MSAVPSIDACYGRIREILNSARASLARSVNTTQVVAHWLVGREIVQHEMGGQGRAEYGRQLLEDLSRRMTAEYGRGYAVQTLWFMRQFFVEYPMLIEGDEILFALRREFGCTQQVGRLNPNLSWTYYRTLLRVNRPAVRAFYEIEAVKNNWSARELERQINTHLYDRLAQSRDKEGSMRLALEGQEVQRPGDVFKDPVVMEFIGIAPPPGLTESALEQAIIDNLQKFLLELGIGFAFIGRQQRFTIEGDHFYVDLVLYHIVLKCFVLVFGEREKAHRWLASPSRRLNGEIPLSLLGTDMGAARATGAWPDRIWHADLMRLCALIVASVASAWTAPTAV